MALGFSSPAFSQETAPAGEKTTAKVTRTAKSKVPTREIKGVVTDMATKAPIPGVHIQSLGNRRYAAMTNDKGEFTIKVPTFETTLYVYSDGFLSQKIAVDKNTTDLQVSIISDHFKTMFTDGTSITASVGSEFSHTTSRTVESDIAERLDGDVRTISRSGTPGYGYSMFIRGLHSLNADAQPLVVIDGIQQDMQYSRVSSHDGEFSDMLLNLNPADVASVQVLKNGTALYGAKGANGVILISTKRGYSQATRIEANVGVGFTLIPNLPDVMDAGEYRNYATEMLGTYPEISTFKGDFKFMSDDKSKFYYEDYHNNTDWTKEVYRTAMVQDYNINVQGGDNVGMYNLSLGFTSDQSNARDNSFNRLNVRFNNDIYILKDLVTRVDMSFTKTNRDVFDDGVLEDLNSAPISAPTFLSLVKSPFLNPYTFNNRTRLISETLSDADDFLTDLDPDLSLANPKAILVNGHDSNKNRTEVTHLNATFGPKFMFNRYLNLMETFSYTYDYNSQRYYRPVGGMPTFTIPNLGPVTSMSKAFSRKETSLVSDTRLDWERIYGPHSFHAYGGLRFLSFSYNENDPTGQYSSGGNDKTPSISNNMQYKLVTGFNDKWKSFTWYGNFDYNYANKYFAQVTLSLESNSRFGKKANGLGMFGVKWGVFPSIQLGWVMSSESWFPKTKAVNYLQVHTGYDMSGNDGISNYAARTSFNLVKYLYNSNGIQLNNIGNDKVKWENTGKFNVGLKSAFLNNRVAFDFDFFFDHTSNLLTLKTINNPVIGVNNYWSNGGSLDNTGFEATISAKPVVMKNFNIEVGGSVGHYTNKVKSLPNDTQLYLDGQKNAKGYLSSAYGVDNIATIIDKPVASFYGYKTKGVYASDAEAKSATPNGYMVMEDATGAKIPFKAGDVRFVDINGDGIIGEADRTIIGDPNPDIYGNIFATINWKHLTLSALFNYSVGNDVFNYERSILEGGSNFYNQTTSLNNRWRGEGQITDVPRIVYGDPMGNSRFSDRWIEDGSFLRLKTLNLTYKIPSSLTWLQGLSIWVEANNLFTITKYLGSDPEFSARNSVLYQGIDPGYMALGRTFTLGMKINL